jgi:hypothetical protein
VLIGHGDGGTIALDFASAQPPLLRGVVAIGAHVMTEPRTISSIRQAREAFLANDLRERLVCYHGENVDEAFSLWADAWLAPGFEPMDAGARLPRVRVPVLALQGERDEYSTVAQLHAIARSVSGRCETRVMPGCGHGPHLQDPDTLVDVVARFIATLWRSPRGSAVITAGVTLLTVALLSAGSATAADASACPENLERVFGEARHDENRVDDGAAAGRLAAANEQASGCAELALAALVLEGWVEARRLALVGGAPGELVRINGILARISAVPATLSRAALLSRSAMYAEAVLRAGVAAAQDERDEMQLYLAHARTLADSLRFGSPARPWPLPIDLVAAELWLEVDRFAEARAAFERVTDPELAGRVALGTAQVLERLDDVIAACGAYRRAAASPLVPIATERAKLAVIRLKCGR